MPESPAPDDSELNGRFVLLPFDEQHLVHAMDERWEWHPVLLEETMCPSGLWHRTPTLKHRLARSAALRARALKARACALGGRA